MPSGLPRPALVTPVGLVALVALASCGDTSPEPAAGAGGSASAGAAGSAGSGGASGTSHAAFFTGPEGTQPRVAADTVATRGIVCVGACAPFSLGLASTNDGRLAFGGLATGQATILDDLHTEAASTGSGFLALLAPSDLHTDHGAALDGDALGATGFVTATGDGMALLASLRSPLAFQGQTFDPAGYPDGAQILLVLNGDLSVRFARVFPWSAVAALAGSREGAVAMALYAPGDLDVGCGPMGGELGTSVVVTLSADGSCFRQRRLGEPADFAGGSSPPLSIGPTEIDDLSFGIGTAVAVAGRFAGRLTIDDRTLEHPGPAAFLADFFDSGELRWAREVAFEGAPGRLRVARDAFGAFAVTTVGQGALDLGHGPRGPDDDEAHGHLARFDYEGLPLWHRVLPSLHGGDLRPAVSADGAVFVAGTFLGELDFGDGPLRSAGGHDAFLTAIAHEAGGAPKWSVRWGNGDDERVDGVAASSTAVFVVGSPASAAAIDAQGGRLVAGVSRLPLP